MTGYSLSTLESNAQIVKNIAEKLGTTIAVSGPIDIISDGNTVYTLANGDAMMANITGTGCMLGCLMGSYVAVEDSLTAATTATARPITSSPVAVPKNSPAFCSARDLQRDTPEL